jgi:xanthine dehydrogenase accessory factor
MMEYSDFGENIVEVPSSVIDKDGIWVIGKKDHNENKLYGPSLDYLASIMKSFDLTILESDGSRNLPIKGWKEFEPVVHSDTDITIGVLGIDSFGKSIDESNVHRVNEFINLAGAKTNEKITLENIKNVISHKNGLFEKAIGRLILFINKVESEEDFNNARSISNMVKNSLGNKLESIIIGSLHNDSFEIDFNSPSNKVSAIVMASGYGKRFHNSNKLLLKYKGDALITNTLKIINDLNFASKIIVYRDMDILKLVKSYNFKNVHNSRAFLGQSESVKLGVLASKSPLGYMFFPGDQPSLDKETVLLLLESFNKNPDKIIIPCFYSKRGSPVIFPSKFRESLLALTGDIGGREIIKNFPKDVLEVQIREESVLMDIDTVNDYNLLRWKEKIVFVRSGGDIATGVIHKLWRSGFFVIVLEVSQPTTIRRKAAFSEAVYEGSCTVEGATALCTKDFEKFSSDKKISWIINCWENENIPVIIDPYAEILSLIKPIALVDAIIAKKNFGTNKNMASITIALGPGFIAGKDVDAVIETNRGHNLGRLIFDGSTMDNTGNPGDICGFTNERVIYSKIDGSVTALKNIGDLVKKDENIGYIESTDPINKRKVYFSSSINGIIRGLIKDGTIVPSNMKICDIDPRVNELQNFQTISDKSRNIAGGVLEGILFLKRKEEKNRKGLVE